MARPVLEIADIFRDHGAAWRKANAGHVSLGQLKVMSAIESCRTAALDGHTHIVRHRTGLPEPVDEHALVRRGLSLDAVETPVSQHGEPVFAEGRWPHQPRRSFASYVNI